MHKNVADAELAKFANLANEWWDLKGKCRALHELNPIRLQFITDRCDLKQKNVIDIGCGGGILSESMANLGACVTGIDAASSVIEIAKLHASQTGLSPLNYVETTVEEYAELHSKSFDVVTCMELLEHVPDPLSVIHASAKLVKPNGHLFFSTLNRTPKSYAFGILAAEYLLKLLPKGTHEYAKFIRPSELDEGLRQAGLDLQELAGVSYNPFTHKAMFSSDLSINYLAYVRRPA